MMFQKNNIAGKQTWESQKAGTAQSKSLAQFRDRQSIYFHAFESVTSHLSVLVEYVLSLIKETDERALAAPPLNSGDFPCSSQIC
jgi:hypothetical protein